MEEAIHIEASLHASPSSEALPPMLQHYVAVKAAHPDCVIFYQVGDFFEVFFDDAVAVSRTLNLTLTSRDKSNPNPIPMCGVPIAAIDSYLDRLVNLGFSVALVSQVEGDASSKGAKAVERKLTRIVTPGVRLLSEKAGSSVVAAVWAEHEDDVSIASTDVQSGEIVVSEAIPFHSLQEELARICPEEIIFPQTVFGERIDRRTGWVRAVEESVRPLAVKFVSRQALGDLRSSAEDGRFTSLSGFEALARSTQRAIVLLGEHIDAVTVESRAPFRRVLKAQAGSVMRIDAMTRRNLELLQNSRDGRSLGSLAAVLDQCSSAVGSRCLRQWLIAPLVSRSEIEERHSTVQCFMNRRSEREKLKGEMSRVADIERIAARIDLRAASPRELGALRDTLVAVQSIRELVNDVATEEETGLLRRLWAELTEIPAVRGPLEDTLADELPQTLQDGGVIRAGANAELDSLRALRRDHRTWLDDFEVREREKTNIQSLKVRSNNMLGFFIEVTRANVAKVPATYQRRQSTANAERFTTPELLEVESAFSSAEGKIQLLERDLFRLLIDKLLPHGPLIKGLARALASLDVLVAFATLAVKENYVRPSLTEDLSFLVRGARHPVLSHFLGARFIPNTIEMREEGAHCHLVTGPNMGGKSTFLRQAGLIAIMAQAGCFVPAEAAEIGIVDQVFARIGASDNLLEGDSTFMVEMREASHIVSNVSRRSLVLIDELGRGTATADGLAIAHAILEWLAVQVGCRTLFATHFHELTGLEKDLRAIGNLSVGVVEEEGQVVFTHAIVQGPANRSYGLEVARLAGLPDQILSRAEEVLRQIPERSGRIRISRAEPAQQRPSRQLTLVAPPSEPRWMTEIVDQIATLHLNETTPLSALQILNDLQTRIVKRQGGAA